jgi:hypothetical protein
MEKQNTRKTNITNFPSNDLVMEGSKISKYYN